ncbi:MAG: NAD(P)-dependent oxidoreductase [Acidimicrobiales bacterium]
MKILLADALPASAVARLEAAGDDVLVDPSLTETSLGGALAGVEVLVVRSTRVTAEALAAADELALIVRAGAGTNTIDTAAAAALGIFVCNVPGQNALAVAELAMGLLISVDRHIASATADLRDGKWNKSAYSKADGLYGKSLGIIGLGDIGLAMAERATGFGIDVIAVDKPDRAAATVEQAERAGVRFVPTLDELLSSVDIVSLHVPGGADTKGMVDAGFLAKMRDRAILINTSRGDVVDEAALIDAMTTRGLRAGLDVFADEPGSGTAEFTSALAGHPSVVATHHVGASTEQAQQAVADGTIDVIDEYRAGGVPVNCVNMQAVPDRAATISIRHQDRVGVLAAVLAILRASDLNVSTMSNKVFAGAKAAVATIDVAAVPDAEILDQIRSHEHVINVAVTLA